MRSREVNSLDLNNFPQDYYTRPDHVTQAEDPSSSPAAGAATGGGGRAEKEEAGKVYECRFCSLKFCKSQALGGHMNRHRQERETETLNKARQLVFSNDLAPPPHPPHHMSYVSSRQGAIPHGGGYQYHQASNNVTDDSSSSSSSSLGFRSIYPTSSRMFSNAPPNNNYYVHGNVVTYAPTLAPTSTSNYYTCIGAPVTTHTAAAGDRDFSPHDQVDGRNWGRR